MKRIIAALLIVGFTCATHAAVIDLSTMTCEKFLASNKDEIGIILAWLEGYYKDEKDPPIINTEKFVANFKMLDAYCAANPTTSLITATDRLFGN
jgi:acid stress chaperone HdeB